MKILGKTEDGGVIALLSRDEFEGLSHLNTSKGFSLDSVELPLGLIETISNSRDSLLYAIRNMQEAMKHMGIEDE